MPKGELEQLRQRKKELLLESDINRQILRVEFCQLRLKADDWKRNMLKVRNVYQWVAPLAGIGFAVYGMKKKMQATREHPKRNGHGRGKAAYMKLLAPLGVAAARQAFQFWKHARKERSA